MEYLEQFDQNLSTYKTEEYDFFNIKDLSGYFYGAPFIHEYTFDKIKDTKSVEEENHLTGGGGAINALAAAVDQTAGIRLRFKTDSNKVLLKVQLKRKYAHQKMTLYCSSGFDIYQFDNSYKNEHRTVAAPKEPNNIFAHAVDLYPQKNTEIYFPCYNRVEKFELGILKNSEFCKAPEYKRKKPIIFYGNSCTQGASASRSGNAYPNIVSRILNSDIINYSFSAACRAEIAMAEQICENDCSAFIIDYQRNAANLEEFRNRYLPFYSYVRAKFPKIPIILVGAYGARVYDDHIKKIFITIKERFENTWFINLERLFENIDPLTISVDNIHYTDIGMFAVAEKIAEVLRQSSADFYE